MEYPCPICQKVFSKKQSRDVHVAMIHEKSGRYKCEHCDRRFVSKTELKRHEGVHMEVKPFECKLCHKRFANKYYLNNHHTNVHAEKKFSCQTCGLSFGKQETLQFHLFVHSKEKPFQCEDCPKQFSCKRYLQIHRANYHSEKGKCEICGKEFRNKVVLQNHLVVHSEEKPFSCEECPRKFSCLRYLKQHRINCHTICNFGADKNPGSRLPGDSKSGDDHQGIDKPASSTKNNESRLAKKSEMVTISSDEDENAELPPPESSIEASNTTNFKLVYDVEYRARENEKRAQREKSPKRLVQTSLKGYMKADSAVQRKTPGKRRLIRGENQKKRPKVPGVKVEQPDSSENLGSATYSLRVRRNTPNYKGHEDVSGESEESGSEFHDSGEESSRSDEETELDEENDQDEESREEADDPVGDNEMTESGVADGEVDDFDELAGSSQGGIKIEIDFNGQVDGNEMHTTRVKTEPGSADGEVRPCDDPSRSSQQAAQTNIKKERLLDGQTENDRPGASEESKDSKFTRIKTETTAFDCFDFNDLVRGNQSRMKAESRSDGHSPLINIEDSYDEDSHDEAGMSPKSSNGSSQQTTQTNIKRERDGGQTDQPGASEASKDRIKTETTAFDCYDFNDLVKSNQSRMKAESNGHSPVIIIEDSQDELIL